MRLRLIIAALTIAAIPAAAAAQSCPTPFRAECGGAAASGGGGGSGTVTSVATGAGLTGGPITSTGTIAWNYTATLAGNPAMNAGECRPATTGFIFEGSTANTFEGLLTVVDPTADRTWTLPNETGAILTDASTINASQIGAGTLDPLRLTAGSVTQFETDLEAVLDLSQLQGSLALGSQTTGGYAGSSTEGGAADTGDSATSFFPVGTLDNARLDADLAAIAGLTSAADKGIQFTGAGAASTFDLTAAGKALLDDASAAAQLTTLGVGPIATTAGATDDTVPVGNGTTFDLKALTNCIDTGGNHLNYTAATNTISCGTSGDGSGGVSGLGSTDNALLRADGTGGSTAQGSGTTLGDTGILTLPTGSTPEIAFGTTISLGRVASSTLRVVDLSSANNLDLAVRNLNFVNGSGVSGGAIQISSQSNQIDLSSSSQVKFCSGNSGSGEDSGIGRVTAKVLQFTDGSSGRGWMQWAGECFVASDQTNATTTMASSTCSITVTSGRKYSFVCELFMSDSVAADGAKIDFNGGTATATNFRAQVTAFDTALNLSSQVTALNTAASATTFTGAGAFEVHGAFEPSANGTFIPEFAQVTHTSGTLTLARGSNCRMFDMP